MGSRWHAVVVDAADPPRLARWWAEVLGLRIIGEEGSAVIVGSGQDRHPVLSFSQCNEPKVGRNRLHLDLGPDDRDAEVERLVDMGARYVESGQDPDGVVVLADPEGNEFRLRAPH